MENELQFNLKQCQEHISTLISLSTNRDEVLKWFQTLCVYLTEIIGNVGQCRKKYKEKIIPMQNTLLLYLTQTLSSLSLIINIFEQEEVLGVVLLETRKCVTKQLNCCLESFSFTFKNDQTLNDPSGNFVKWMDAALDKMNAIANNEINSFYEARHLFEEVLSHAMSIAQVSLPEDSKIIRGSCQSVLCALRSLEEELTKSKQNNALINLFIDISNNKLCSLERKVNTAVLRLCLRTFGNFEEPLENLREFCFADSDRKADDVFDGLVAEFDLHVDRIMQIGLFAVSCSSDAGQGVKIRSCLASLEALESELVPSLSSLLNDRSIHNLHCAKILMRHWLNQAFALRGLIYLIIDPCAFCHRIYEDICEKVEDMTIKNKEKNILERQDVEDLIKAVKVLQHFLDRAKPELEENEKNKLMLHLNDFNNVVTEVQCASKILLSDQESSKRLLKRCKILQTLVKRVWYCFVEEKDVSSEKKVESPPQPEPMGNVFLDHIINRGKQILHDRSILYKTPVKMGNHQKQEEVPLFKLVHLKNLSFMNESSKNQKSIDLHITDILNEMTNLTTSFHKINPRS